MTLRTMHELMTEYMDRNNTITEGLQVTECRLNGIVYNNIQEYTVTAGRNGDYRSFRVTYDSEIDQITDIWRN